MRPRTVTLSSTGTSEWIPVNYALSAFNVGVHIVPSNGASVVWSVQVTNDDPFTVLIPSPFEAPEPINTGTTFQMGNITTPCRAIRLAATIASGTVTMTVVQGR